MPTDEEFDKLKAIVVLQTELIGEIANALDSHELDGPHYTKIHLLEALTKKVMK